MIRPSEKKDREPARRIFNRPPHRQRPLRYWLLALALVVAIVALLPYLVGKLG